MPEPREDGMHIATITNVWTGSTVGGVPVTRLHLQIAGEDESIQKTIGGHRADALFGGFGVRDPKALRDTRWIVQVKGTEIDLVRPA